MVRSPQRPPDSGAEVIRTLGVLGRCRPGAINPARVGS